MGQESLLLTTQSLPGGGIKSEKGLGGSHRGDSEGKEEEEGTRQGPKGGYSEREHMERGKLLKKKMRDRLPEWSK